jgi:hypothetical protein
MKIKGKDINIDKIIDKLLEVRGYHSLHFPIAL